MLSDRLAWLLEKQADRLTKGWVTMLKSNVNTKSYHDIEDTSLIARIHEVYQKMSLWLDWEVSSRALARYFMMIGQERKNDTIAISEVVYAIILARRNLFDFLNKENISETALDLQRIIEFNARVNYFFDKAVYFVIRGYELPDEKKVEDEGWLDRVLSAFTIGTSSHDKP
ncbi:MAG: hypothetical protein HQ509_03175 [Candidatus Marinimicrobia bacterium]|nr:hypothetical protein [Candidatus Neomarinimicrobiota bacterium]